VFFDDVIIAYNGILATDFLRNIFPECNRASFKRWNVSPALFFAERLDYDSIDGEMTARGS